MFDDYVVGERRRKLAKIAIDWAVYDRNELAFEKALAAGEATLVDHPLPNGGVLGTATDEQVALAAKQFEHRGQDLLALAEWLRVLRSAPTQLDRPERAAKYGQRVSTDWPVLGRLFGLGSRFF
jgi:hypothetical protein